MPFSNIPTELVHNILVVAVRLRSLKRAVRLRLVSRAWNTAVEYALFDSGLLDKDRFIASAFCRDAALGFWQRYLAYRVLHNTKWPSRRLMMICQLAECIIDMRSQKICHVAMVFGGLWKGTEGGLMPEGKPIARFDRDCGGFWRALLAATACTNDVDLVVRLQSARSNIDTSKATGFSTDTVDIPREIYRSKRVDTPELPFDEYSAAAYNGNVEVISVLMANEAQMGKRSSFNASSPDFPGLREYLVSALQLTTNIDIFKRCFELVKDHLQHHPCRRYDPVHLQELPKNGAVVLLEFLAELCLAAANGHEDVVRWLLNRDAAIDRSLHAAVAHGSYGITRLLLEHGAINDHEAVQMALIESIKKEHETLFWLLVSYGARLDEETHIKAMGIAKKEQLDSMEKLLEEYANMKA
ncbi:ankyrin [Xylaria arbuscula]|nr:ankyrin [Xylaria arbuscula]